MQTVLPRISRMSAPASSDRSGRPARPRLADVSASYDLGVEAYDTLWGPVIRPAAAALLPFMRFDEANVVLDVGGGAGATSELIRASAGLDPIVLDPSKEMLRIARGERRLRVVQGDAMRMPFASGCADVVVLAYVLFHLADPLVALRETARVLRAGAVVGCVTWASERAERAQQIWTNALTDAGAPPLPPRRVDEGLSTADDIGRMLRRAGLRPHEIWHHQLSHQWDAASFLALLTGSGVQRQRLQLLDHDARTALLTRVGQELTDLPAEDFWWEGEALCAIAEKPDD